jgi:guanine deaminase
VKNTPDLWNYARKEGGFMTDVFAVKGNICYNKDVKHLEVLEHGYVLCKNGVSLGAYPVLPEAYAGIPCKDYGDALIVPGMTDLHIHAPQYAFRGTSMDLELLEWLNTVTFPQESRYQDEEYAAKAYGMFADDLKKGATTRACIFGTLHVKSTEILMDRMEETGIHAYIGKVNMDRNSPEILCEESAKRSAEDTVRWLEDTAGKYRHVKPMLTPRFTPSCSDELMERLSGIQKEYRLPVQSHLSENLSEIDWVRELCPGTRFYGESYDRFGLFGGDCPTVMAHCVHCPEEEIALMKERGVYIAHCPQSNTDLSSGIAPIRRYLEEGMHVGIGTDVAGGHSPSVMRQISDAIAVSKLRWRLVDDSLKALTFSEAFYMATIGGGSFFGKVGSFEEGYEFDAVVLCDDNLSHPQPLDPKQRLERLIYLGDDRNIIGKYVAGEKIF